MSNIELHEMRRSINEAKNTVRRGQIAAQELVGFIATNADLRHCDPLDLEKLKRELRDFNMKTGRWKDQ